MLGFFNFRRFTGQRTFWVDQFCRRKRGSTPFALITISFFVTAVRADSFYISVREKHIRFGIIQLFLCFLFEETFFVQIQKEFLRKFMMSFGTRSAIMIKRNSKILEYIFYLFVVAIYNILR